jgi:phosphoglycerol transferase MdoB-like AlkP superfamily enzyme
MMDLEFLKSKKFFSYYLLITTIALILTLVFNALGLVGNLTIQTIAGVLTVIAIPLLVILVLLIFSRANRSDDLGRKIIRLNYLTVIVLCICLVFIMFASIINSFNPDPASPGVFGRLLAVYLFATGIGFGICLSQVCRLTLGIERAWLFTK